VTDGRTGDHHSYGKRISSTIAWVFCGRDVTEGFSRLETLL
jgi:hypothetical protein